MRIDQSRFNIVAISDSLVTSDSTIIELTDSGVIVSKVNTSINGRLIKSEIENQLLYTNSIKIGDNFHVIEIYSGNIEWPPFDQLSVNLIGTVLKISGESFSMEVKGSIL
ncbi:hypothetical protein GYB29_07490 [bacterium]|nr:hypothetical protein [bacterium]